MSRDGNSHNGVNKEIRLYPTHFLLDVYINYEIDELTKQIKSKYKIGYDFDVVNDGVFTAITNEDKTRIVLCLETFDLAIIVHELVHVFYHLDDICDLGHSTENQEWIAYFTDYLFTEILKLKDNG